MKKTFITIICFITITLLDCNYAIGRERSYSPPENLKNILLTTIDLPAGVIFNRKNSTFQEMGADGWEKPNLISIWDVFPGLSESVTIGVLKAHLKYGYFPLSENAKYAVRAEVRMDWSGLMTRSYLESAFDGSVIGDNTYRWEMSMESRPGVTIRNSDYGKLGFCCGRYGFYIHGGWMGSTWGTVNKSILDTIARTVEKKIRIAQSLDEYSTQLPALISNKGILHSLQVKLDHFTQNYRQSDYKVALNNIDSFINELSAQRGKHVSESAYQTLKGYADTIVQSLNSLM
ncbi:MAG TPA: hypothetical protein PLL56_13105 [Verrucomicrobiota bacterium]|nr:hypothetical protein [Verrucomicrobiota bacterium]